MRSAVAALLVAALAGCTHTTVTPSGPGVAFPPRPEGCAITFFRTKAPDAVYVEVAAIHVGARTTDPAWAQEELRQRACALGADAVIVTRDFAFGMMTGTAIRFRDRPAAETAVGPAPAPAPGFVPARVVEPAVLRRSPDASAPAIADLPVGTQLIVAEEPAVRGFRRARTAGGQDGWVLQDRLAVAAAPPGSTRM